MLLVHISAWIEIFKNSQYTFELLTLPRNRNNVIGKQYSRELTLL